MFEVKGKKYRIYAFYDETKLFMQISRRKLFLSSLFPEQLKGI
jgi:hypothetical protein